MALTTNREDIYETLSRIERDGAPEGIADLSRRLDALVEAVEILSRDQYEFPTLPESNLRNALSRARGR